MYIFSAISAKALPTTLILWGWSLPYANNVSDYLVVDNSVQLGRALIGCRYQLIPFSSAIHLNKICISVIRKCSETDMYMRPWLSVDWKNMNPVNYWLPITKFWITNWRWRTWLRLGTSQDVLPSIWPGQISLTAFSFVSVSFWFFTLKKHDKVYLICEHLLWSQKCQFYFRNINNIYIKY